MCLPRRWRFAPLEEHSVNITIHFAAEALLLNVLWKLKEKSGSCLVFLFFSFVCFLPSELKSEFPERDGCSESVTHLSGADNSGNPERQAAAQSGEDGPS